MSTLKFNKIRPFGVEVLNFAPTFENISHVRTLLLEESLVLIRNFQDGVNENLLELAETLSIKKGSIRDKVLHWDFGPVMEMKFDPSSPNYLFSAEKVPFHWDGAFHQEPKFLMFYCLESNGLGGETLFTRTPNLIQQNFSTRQKDLETIQLNFTTEKKAHYGGSIHVNLLQKHPETNEAILRFAEEVKTSLNPVHLKINSKNSDQSESVFNEIAQLVYDPKFCFEHTWTKNDLLIVDNFSCVHGRNELKENTVRKFKRIQVL